MEDHSQQSQHQQHAPLNKYGEIFVFRIVIVFKKDSGAADGETEGDKEQEKSDRSCESSAIQGRTPRDRRSCHLLQVLVAELFSACRALVTAGERFAFGSMMV